MKRVVLMFKPQFAPLVASGTKRQTIRPIGRRRIEPCMIADCREWIGKPYRSKQRKLCQGEIFHVRLMEIRMENIFIQSSLGGEFYQMPDLRGFEIAKADGFSGWSEMRDWFEKQHGLPFKGRLIMWEPLEGGK